MYFHSKLAWPPANYDVISRNHSNWPSLNVPQNLREGWTNSYWKRLVVMIYPTGKNSEKPDGRRGTSTPSHPLVRPRVKMTKSVTANCVGVGSTRSVLQDWSVKSPTPYYIIWWLTFIFPQIYTNYMFSKIEVRLNICIIKSSQRDIVGKTGSDFPEEMSHQISIVIKSWGSSMISLNQSKASHFYFAIVNFFCEWSLPAKFVIGGKSKDRLISSAHDGYWYEKVRVFILYFIMTVSEACHTILIMIMIKTMTIIKIIIIINIMVIIKE